MGIENNGNIMVTGLLQYDNNTTNSLCQSLSIIGGTGTFIYSEGYVDICWPNFNNKDSEEENFYDLYKHTLHFVDSGGTNTDCNGNIITEGSSSSSSSTTTLYSYSYIYFIIYML